MPISYTAAVEAFNVGKTVIVRTAKNTYLLNKCCHTLDDLKLYASLSCELSST